MFWALCSLLAPYTSLALSLRSSAGQSPETERISIAKYLDAWEHSSRFQGIPPTESEFSAIWNWYDTDCHDNIKPSLPEGALLVGVFSTENDFKYQKVIKKTWMNHPGVCPVGGGQKPGCTVYVAFVVGNSGVQCSAQDTVDLNDGVLMESNDTYVLKLCIHENMNKGKTLTWFYHASRKYPWATHIAKADMDLFPWMAKLTTVLYKLTAFPNYEYLGAAGMHGSSTRPDCRNNGNLTPSNLTCPYYAGFDIQRYSGQWMTGGFYGFSRNLALAVTEKRGYWSTLDYRKRKVGEDILTGEVVHQWSLTSEQCVYVRLLDRVGLHHRGAWSPNLNCSEYLVTHRHNADVGVC